MALLTITTAFLSKLLAPIQKAEPYYADRYQRASTTAGRRSSSSWLPNAWSAAQATCLQTKMAKQTTYTFVIRHEPSAALNAPGVVLQIRYCSTIPTLSFWWPHHTYEHFYSASVRWSSEMAALR